MMVTRISGVNGKPRLAALALLLVACVACDHPDTGPRQPVAFSHAIHAGRNRIACQYCHSGVRRSASAGIPSMRLCMGCHQLVAATRPDIILVREAFENRNPLQWMRVNVLADFVYFNHYPHIARGFACQTCHGPVETMAEVRPVVSLADMAFCVNCHRAKGGPVDCYTCHR